LKLQITDNLRASVLNAASVLIFQTGRTALKLIPLPRYVGRG